MTSVYIVALVIALAGSPASAVAHPPQECINSTTTFYAFPPDVCVWVVCASPQFSLVTPLQSCPAGSSHRRIWQCCSSWAAGETQHVCRLLPPCLPPLHACGTTSLTCCCLPNTCLLQPCQQGRGLLQQHVGQPMQIDGCMTSCSCLM